MVYLYAGLGIAMISGISAMMQIANNLNNVEKTVKAQNSQIETLKSHIKKQQDFLVKQQKEISQLPKSIKKKI